AARVNRIAPGSPAAQNRGDTRRPLRSRTQRGSDFLTKWKIRSGWLSAGHRPPVRLESLFLILPERSPALLLCGRDSLSGLSAQRPSFARGSGRAPARLFRGLLGRPSTPAA